ncbi:MAG TPA: nuclear transport factor 2 family protein [Pseudonocardiaceae bacterium]|jgi:hypothetical protein|nr:nuclear transport factor 2 family protein [Pseudonocardiaceae bacterium]
MATELPAPVRRAVDAANGGDLDGFLDAFTETGAVDDSGRTFRGRAAITGWSDTEFIGKQVTLDVTGVEPAGDTVMITAQVGGNGFNGPSHFAFTVAGDRVTLMKITG